MRLQLVDVGSSESVASPFEQRCTAADRVDTLFRLYLPSLVQKLCCFRVHAHPMIKRTSLLWLGG